MRSTQPFILALFIAACGSDSTPGPGPGVTGIEVSANIETDTTFTNDQTYVLTNHIFVKNATLTIEPGTTILGMQGTSLVVTPSGRLIAEGTKEKPIVFTSGAGIGFREPGNWGGVILLGNAPINVGANNNIEGFPNSGNTVYGGNDANHNCGSLRYVRIEFAGFKLSEGNEINGLTVGGCGKQTRLDFIQVHKGNDDGIEFFGGNADIKHVVITQPDDDGLDADFGWTGRVQYLIVQQNQTVGEFGFEFDNNKDNNDALPRTAPVIFNATLVGSNAEPQQAGKVQKPMLLRRGTAATMRNLVVTHFADGAIDLFDSATFTQANDGALSVENSFFFDNANDQNSGWPATFEESDDGFNEATFFTAAPLDNTFASNPELVAPLNLTAPNFAPGAGSPVLAGAVAPEDAFFDSVTFLGAIGTDDWTTGWTAYPAN